MTSKIFKSIFSVAMGVLLASLTIITGVLYQYFGNIQETQLRDELSLAASATEQLGQEYLQNIDSDRYRLTWIAADGRCYLIVMPTLLLWRTMQNERK